jgi:chemotaxis response regulator CheB
MTDFQTNAAADSGPPPICAIGASAGGVRALQDFFGAIEADLGLSYVVVIHLAPDHPSQLSSILAERTKMPVEQVEHALQLQPNCVYVIAPDRELVIEGGSLTPKPLTEPRNKRAPIDRFFRSVAISRSFCPYRAGYHHPLSLASLVRARRASHSDRAARDG